MFDQPLKCLNRFAIVFAIVAAPFYSQLSYAADPLPGAACSVNNARIRSGGPETSGIIYDMTCQSSVWVPTLTYLANSNVGIGTTSPYSLLEVYNGSAANSAGQNTLTLTATLNAAALGSGPRLLFKSWSSEAAAIRGYTFGASDTGLAFDTGWGGPTTKMVINNAGNVGIGTAAPSKNLEVAAADASTEIRVINTTSSATRTPTVSVRNYKNGQASGNPQIQLLNSGGTSATTAALASGERIGMIAFDGVYNTSGGYSSAAEIIGEADGAFASGDTPGRLIFRTTTDGTGSGSEKMRITNAGNVGIGTTAPSSILDIMGSTTTRGMISYGAISAYGSTQYVMNIHRNDAAAGNLEVSRFTRSRSDATAPTAGFGGNIRLEAEGFTIQSTAAAGSIQWGWEVDQTDDTNARDGYLAFNTTLNGASNSTSGDERMRITSSGRVGIGTAAPNYMLEVRAADTSVQTTVVNSNSTASKYPGFKAMNFMGAAATGYPVIDFVNSRGTLSVPAAIQSGDYLGGIAFSGAVDSAWNQSQGATISSTAAENFSGTASGGNLIFSTTPTGTASVVERMRITSAGNVGIGTTNPTTSLMVLRGEGNTTGTETYNYSDSVFPYVYGYRARNTISSPMPVLSGNALFVIGAGGYHSGSAFSSDRRAGIIFRTEEAWTSSAHGSRIEFEVTPIGSTSRGVGMVIKNDSSVGIGTTSPADKLQVAGDLRVGTGTTGCVKDADGTVLTGTCSSDVRFKKDIEPLGSKLEQVSRLRPVTYKWRSEEFPDKHFGHELETGLIAQEVQQTIPELVTQDEEGYLKVRFSELNFYILQAVKELYHRILGVESHQEAQDRKIQSLEQENAEMRARLERLEKKLQNK